MKIAVPPVRGLGLECIDRSLGLSNILKGLKSEIRTRLVNQATRYDMTKHVTMVPVSIIISDFRSSGQPNQGNFRQECLPTIRYWPDTNQLSF